MQKKILSKKHTKWVQMYSYIVWLGTSLYKRKPVWQTSWLCAFFPWFYWIWMINVVLDVLICSITVNVFLSFYYDVPILYNSLKNTVCDTTYTKPFLKIILSNMFCIQDLNLLVHLNEIIYEYNLEICRTYISHYNYYSLSRSWLCFASVKAEKMCLLTVHVQIIVCIIVSYVLINREQILSILHSEIL